MDPTPHRPDSESPSDELPPTLRAAVEAVRRQPVPPNAQEESLRRIEEELSMKPQPNQPFWSHPALAFAVLAASVAVSFCAGYWMRPPATTPLPDLANHIEPKQAPEKATNAPHEPGNDKKDSAPPADRRKMEGEAKTRDNPDKPTAGPQPSNQITPTSGPQGNVPVPIISPPGTAGQGGQGGLGIIPGPVPPPGLGLPGGNPIAPALPPLTAQPDPRTPTAPFPSPTVTPPVKMPVPGEGKPGRDGKEELVTITKELAKITRTLTLDEQTRVTRFAETWGKLPVGDRKKSLEDIKDLPPEKQAAVVALARAQAAVQQGQPDAEGIGGESYNHFVDNPYQAVQNAPLSTFSISVDTASYSNVRRILMQEGRLPPTDAVRIADMVNYFPYTYPQPKGQDPVAFAMNIATCPWNTDHQLLRVALAARTYTQEQMPPRNFVFLLDTSGSMNSKNKLPLLIESFKLLVDQLRAQDRVAIAVYAGSAGLVLESTPGNEKEKILASLDKLQAGGSTNGGDGIRLAYKVAKDAYIKGGVNRVILGTDGDFNVGTTDQAELIRLIEEYRKTNVYLTVLGFGYGNLKDATMERLAHHGNGYFAYVDNIAEGKKIFVEQGGALATVAKDVKLQIEFNPQRVAGYRLIGYENKLLRDQDFNDDKIDAGDMGSGHTVTALYEIIPAGTRVPNVAVDDLKYAKPALPAEAANTGEFLTVKMRYKDPEADTSKKLEQPLAGAVENFAKANDELRWAAAVVEFGMLLRNSPYKGTATYAHVLDTAEKGLGAEDKHRVEFLAVVKKARDLATAAEKKDKE